MTVACVLVNGHVKVFRPEYVIKLANMVRPWMDRPYRFVCLTDYPRMAVRNIDLITIPSPAKVSRRFFWNYTAGDRVFAWWSKLELFNPKHGLSGRVLYLDLDALVVGPLAPILDYPSDFALIPDEGQFAGKFGLKVVKRFNSSVMVWDADGEKPKKLWNKFTPSVPAALWGDQDFIGEQIPDADTMPAEWFPRISALTELRQEPPKPPVKVVLCKWPKNTIAAEWYPWVQKVWQ